MAGILEYILNPTGILGAPAQPQPGLMPPIPRPNPYYAPPLGASPQPLATGPQGAAGTGILDRLNALYANNPQAMMALGAGLLSGSDTRDSLARGVSAFSQGLGADQNKRTEMAQRTAMNDWLRQRAGLSETDAKLLSAYPEAAGAYIQRALAPKEFEPTDDIREFSYAKSQGFDGSFQDWIKQSKPGTTINIGDQARERAEIARQYGIDPNSPTGQSYIMTGRLPREDQQPLTATDKKAILDADEMVMAAESTLPLIERAKTLSKTAYEGATANERGWLMSQFGVGAANDTRELNSVVTEQALAQLKTIFGGNPTEGERKILLDIQGSAELPQTVRDNLYERAEAAVKRRLDFYRQRANELRGGTFYGANGRPSPSGNQPAPSNGSYRILGVE